MSNFHTDHSFTVTTLGFSETPYILLLKTMASSKTDADHQGNIVYVTCNWLIRMAACRTETPKASAN